MAKTDNPVRKKAARKSPKKNRRAGKTSGARERKDQVLQARVPKSLYDDLVAQAARLRVPVSNLVRNILEDSVRMVGNIVDSGIQIAGVLSGRPGSAELSSVVGWQPMIANRPLACARCGKEVPKGGEAYVGMDARGGRNLVICKECECEL
jgi:hypothetical protein